MRLFEGKSEKNVKRTIRDEEDENDEKSEKHLDGNGREGEEVRKKWRRIGKKKYR